MWVTAASSNNFFVGDTLFIEGLVHDKNSIGIGVGGGGEWGAKNFIICHIIFRPGNGDCMYARGYGSGNLAESGEQGRLGLGLVLQARRYVHVYVRKLCVPTTFSQRMCASYIHLPAN